jgi:small conductance mechanosensitive channel
MQSDIVNQLSSYVNTYLIPFGWKILGAVAVWIVGSWVIKLLRAGLGRTLLARKVDPTLARYAEAGANVLLKLLLFIAVLSVLGIETTSFAALLAALGIAIGAAWGGLLANFAAGMFLMVLRPFKVGDMITVAGVTGDVREIGLFVTALDTVDNVRIFSSGWRCAIWRDERPCMILH